MGSVQLQDGVSVIVDGVEPGVLSVSIHIFSLHNPDNSIC